MANGIPEPLANLLGALRLEGLPASARPGDRITMRLTPDLAPQADRSLPRILQDLAAGELLGELDIDPGAFTQWLIDALDLAGWWKGVEFNQPINVPAAQLDQTSQVQWALPHAIPGPGPGLNLIASGNVEGLIGHLELIRDRAAGNVATITGTIRKPGLLGAVSQPQVTVEVRDEAGTLLQSGDGHFKSNAFVPELVFLPVAVASAAAQPTVRRTIAVHVALTFTPPGGAAPIAVDQVLGPFPIDIATIEVPLVAVLARHALAPGAAPGHVFVGVPEGSPLGDLGQVLGALGTARTVLNNVRTVLGALGIAIPGALADAIRAANFLPSVTAEEPRFARGNLLGLFALFADWQYIMSAALVFGPQSRRVTFGTVRVFGTTVYDLAAFSLRPASLGVGFIPDLNNPAIVAAPTVGTATDDIPLAAGTYDNRITSVHFPAA